MNVHMNKLQNGKHRNLHVLLITLILLNLHVLLITLILLNLWLITTLRPCNPYLQEVRILREGIHEPNTEKKEICTLKLF